MITRELQPLFWDTDLNRFDPQAHPDYAIFRVLEYGDENAVVWMQQTFRDALIRRVIRSERRLSLKSANFWSLRYGIPHAEVAALTH